MPNSHASSPAPPPYGAARIAFVPVHGAEGVALLLQRQRVAGAVYLALMNRSGIDSGQIQ